MVRATSMRETSRISTHRMTQACCPQGVPVRLSGDPHRQGVEFGAGPQQTACSSRLPSLKSSPRALPAACKQARGGVSAMACARQPAAARAARGSSPRGLSLVSALSQGEAVTRAAAAAPRSRAEAPTRRPRPEEPSPLPVPEPSPPLTKRRGSLAATEKEKSQP